MDKKDAVKSLEEITLEEIQNEQHNVGQLSQSELKIFKNL